MNNFSAINIFNTNIRHLSGPRLIEKGRSLVTLINGNAFYPLSSWLNDIRLKFWKKPISDQDTSQLMLFCLGDGFSLHFITKWILTSQNWATAKKGEKLARQIFYQDFIMNNIDSKSHIWFYFDLHQGNGLFLMDKLGTQAIFKYTYFKSSIKYLSLSQRIIVNLTTGKLLLFLLR